MVVVLWPRAGAFLPRILSFPSHDATSRAPAIVAMARKPDLKAWQVVTSILPGGERLPTLVRRETWLPAPSALRWVVLARRLEVAVSTLGRDIDGLRYVYAWAEARFEGGLEARLAAGPLDHTDLISLREYLRQPDPAGKKPGAVGGASAGARALSAKLFLIWAISPSSRNQRGAEPRDALEVRAAIEGVLGPLAKQVGRGRDRVAPENSLLDHLELLLRPQMGVDGRFSQPLAWHPKNPFEPEARVRNWLMYCLARDCGLRIGEILCLRAADIISTDGTTYVRIVRRPDDESDPRSNAPAIKTLERVVPLSPHGVLALRTYLTSRGPSARKKGSPFLIQSERGLPLSKSPAAAVMKRLRGAGNIEDDFSWHHLRHAWATEYVREVLRDTQSGRAPVASDEAAMRALLVDKLRLVGGWSQTSTMPMKYAMAALREHAIMDMAAVQARNAERAMQAAQQAR